MVKTRALMCLRDWLDTEIQQSIYKATRYEEDGERSAAWGEIIIITNRSLKWLTGGIHYNLLNLT